MGSVYRVFLAAFLLLPVGCYRYVNADPQDVTPGTLIRAQLTEARTEEVRRYFGPGVESVEGPLVRLNGAEVGILMRTYVSRPGFRPTSVADTVKLLPPHIGGFEVRNLDKWRTAGFAAVIAGGGVVAVLAPRGAGVK